MPPEVDRFCFECNKVHRVEYRGETLAGEEVLYCKVKHEEYTLFMKPVNTGYEGAKESLKNHMPNMALAYIALAFYELALAYLIFKEPNFKYGEKK